MPQRRSDKIFLRIAVGMVVVPLAATAYIELRGLYRGAMQAPRPEQGFSTGETQLRQMFDAANVPSIQRAGLAKIFLDADRNINLQPDCAQAAQDAEAICADIKQKLSLD